MTDAPETDSESAKQRDVLTFSQTMHNDDILFELPGNIRTRNPAEYCLAYGTLLLETCFCLEGVRYGRGHGW